MSSCGFLGVCVGAPGSGPGTRGHEQTGGELDGLVRLGRVVFVEERTHSCAPEGPVWLLRRQVTENPVQSFKREGQARYPSVQANQRVHVRSEGRK